MSNDIEYWDGRRYTHFYEWLCTIAGHVYAVRSDYTRQLDYLRAIVREVTEHIEYVEGLALITDELPAVPGHARRKKAKQKELH